MIKSFKEDKDIYSTIASLAFNLPYEQCCERNPVTGEYQQDGYDRRSAAKKIVLGVCYGMSVPTIGEQIYGKDMQEDVRTKKAQAIYDSVMKAFPELQKFMVQAEQTAKRQGYVETILGRRRHIPEMQLNEFEFVPMKGYVNPYFDPLDPNTLEQADKIPDSIVTNLKIEFSKYKYFGQIVRRTKELYEQKIKVINNRKKIQDGKRLVINSIVQGSAAEQTKMALLRLYSSDNWKKLGGRVLVPVHDEILAEVPMRNWKEAGDELSKCMKEAASFLPYASKCDVKTSMRWYGLDYPCIYSKPKSFSMQDELSEDEVKYIQYCLVEMEYILPVFKGEDGKKPKGDPAVGVNGIVTEEYKNAIIDYMYRFKITEEQFLEHITNNVFYGIY